MRFSIGYQLTDGYDFVDCIDAFSDVIGEVYFPWLGIADGRGRSVSSIGFQEEMESDLRYIHDKGVKLSVLFNSTCYGARELSNSFGRQIEQVISHISEFIGLESVTTTSLFVAKEVKHTFPWLEIRASVNMEITTIRQMEYLSEYFDSFYVGRSVNRDVKHVNQMHDWCTENSKKLFLLANSGCLSNCPAHTYHDNLVAHEQELAASGDMKTPFYGICWEYLSKKQHQQAFRDDTTWIRPEDLFRYENKVDGVKLATRTHKNPMLVIKSYGKKSFDGNMLQLCEPDYSSLFALDNKQMDDSYLKQ